jgi:hypothetical protein
VDREEQIEFALLALQNHEGGSIDGAAAQFIFVDLLQRRVFGGKSKPQAAETQQNLSNAEKTSARWIS